MSRASPGPTSVLVQEQPGSTDAHRHDYNLGVSRSRIDRYSIERSRYPDTFQLVLLADCDGSNSCRICASKYALQHRFCNSRRLPIIVAPYPAGCSNATWSNIVSSARSAATGQVARLSPSI